MKNKNVKDEKKEKKIGLTTKIFIALLLGAVFGIVLCYLIPDSKVKNDIIVEGILYVIGQGFIRLMKMLVVPLVILFPCVRKYGNWRYEEARNSRCQNIGILPRNNSSCCNSCFISW